MVVKNLIEIIIVRRMAVQLAGKLQLVLSRFFHIQTVVLTMKILSNIRVIIASALLILYQQLPLLLLLIKLKHQLSLHKKGGRTTLLVILL